MDAANHMVVVRLTMRCELNGRCTSASLERFEGASCCKEGINVSEVSKRSRRRRRRIRRRRSGEDRRISEEEEDSEESEEEESEEV